MFTRACWRGAPVSLLRTLLRPRRFYSTQLVDNEIIGSFVDQQFLDPEDDRVLDELLGRPIADGLALGDLVPRD